MSEFDYILEKITSSEIVDFPFKHLYISDFLSEEHLVLLTTSEQIKVPPQSTTRELIQKLMGLGYGTVQFPGCVTDIEQYITSLESNNFKLKRPWLESFGVAFALENIKSTAIQDLVTFLNSQVFHQCLEQKFNITRPNRITTGIQKYLSGYEISPHPDIRSKCLTYLVNINTTGVASDMDIHTHLLQFKPKYEKVKQYWEKFTDKERNWVPWDWCDTKLRVSANNSLVMFEPSNDTLHAVRLNYDHCQFQRTQLYGNLWFETKRMVLPETTYQQLEKFVK